jgi:hypothetical protein
VSSNPPHRSRLDSWKQIAVYLNRDVTTVRRWEKRERLPVHRHQHAAQGSVYAFTDEIDAWQSGRDEPVRAELPRAHVKARPPLVGRETELRRLQAHLAEALKGNRRTVFIAGELGIGKTALTQSFLDALSSDVWVVTGQCVEQYGRGEPYLPIIEGLERLTRDSRYPDAMRVVEAHAPSWFEAAPGASRGRRHRRMTGPTTHHPGHIVGELIDALEALAAVTPLIVLLEDLHWSDPSTVELIARLGRRPDPARVLVVGTYRLADLVDSGSPLLRVGHELRAHFQADEIELPLLTQEAIALLIARDRKWSDLRGTAARLRHWSGNPLFLVHLLEHLESSGSLLERDGEWALDPHAIGRPLVPHRLRTLLEDQVDRIGPENRRLLEIASVAGDPFSALLVANAAPHDVTVVERAFEDLCRRTHLILQRERVRLPDGTSSQSYAFVHEFYRQVVYERLPAATVTELHRQIGLQLEARYGDRIAEIASELATHFDRGHDLLRAAHHYASAADNALTQNADREAQIAMSRAAELVVQVRAGAEREAIERRLRAQVDAVSERLARSIPWIRITARSDASRPTADTDSLRLLESLLDLSWIHTVSGDLAAATQISDRTLALANVHRHGLFDAIVQQALVRSLAGEFMISRSLASGALMAADRDGVSLRHRGRTRCWLVLAWNAWCLGLYDESRRMLDRIDTSVEDDDRPLRITQAAPLFEWLGLNGSRSLESHRIAGRRSQDVMDALWSIDAVDGWLLVRRGHVADGLRMLQDSARESRDTGALSALPQTLGWLAEGFLMEGLIDQARAAAEDGLTMIRTTGVRCCDPELYRLRGEAMLATRRSGSDGQLTDRDRDAAEASFWAGITVARQQEARTLELRATVSLAHLLIGSGREHEATRTLTPICESFGVDQTAPDLEKARNLLSGNSANP